MEQERSKQLKETFREKDMQKNKQIMVDISQSSLKETIGYRMSDLEPYTVKDLEALGFKVIYPAELSEDRVYRMSTREKYFYDYQMKEALIIDGKEQSHSLELAKIISNHYLSADTIPPGYWGIDETGTSLTKDIEFDHYKEGTAEKLQELLSDIGVNPTLDGESITISSDIPYPTVRKSKFEQIYDKAKGKIQGTFAKLKALVKPKDQVKENNTNERE